MSIQDEPQHTATTVDEGMAAWEAGVQRMKEELQSRHPELFDESGEVRADEAVRRMKQYADERGLTLTEVFDLASRGFRRQADAS